MKRRYVRNLCLLSLLLIIGISTALLVHSYRREQANYALILAVKANDTEKALEALQADADPNVCDHGEEVPSFRRYLSALWNRVRGIPLRPKRGLSALGFAVERNNTLVVQALLSRGARDAGDTLKVTYSRFQEVSAPLLMTAANNRNVAIVQALVKHGWKVNAGAEDRATALFAAGDAATVQALVSCGAKLNVANNEWHTPLDIALYNHADDVAGALVDLGAYDKNAIPTAVINGNIEPLKKMFHHHWKLDTPNEYGSTPLMSALLVSYARSPQAILLLIQQGANVNSQDRQGRTPLMAVGEKAVQEGPMAGSYPELMKALLDRGTRINVQDRQGFTPLMTAAEHADPILVRLLLLHGARVNMRSHNGDTALDFATQNGFFQRKGQQPKVIRLLKAAGAVQ